MQGVGWGWSVSLGGALLVFLRSATGGPAAPAGPPRPVTEPRLALAALREAGRVGDIDAVAAASPEAWGPVPRIGRSKGEAVFWVRLTLESTLSESREFVLLPARFWPRVDLYGPAPSGGWRVETSGVGVPLGGRPVRIATPMFRVFVSPGVQVRYARMQARLDDYVVPTEVGFDIRSWPAFLEEDLRGRRFQGIYAGLILAMVLYVDYFKAYNDHHGRPAGDRCLQQVAGALSERCRRAGDLLARYGGEEFAVVLPGTGQTGAAQKGEMLRKAVEGLALPHVPGVSLDVVSVSVGVGTAQPVEGASSADLLARADRALHAAKDAGRNRLASAPA